MKIEEKIKQYLIEMNFVSKLTKLTTQDINDYIKDFKIKILDSRYVGLYKDSDACYLSIFKDDIEDKFYIGKIWFHHLLGKGIFVSRYTETIDPILNNEDGFNSLKDAQQKMKSIRYSKELVKI